MTEQQLECLVNHLKRTQNFFNTTYLGKPYSETEQPEIPVYRVSYPTNGIDLGNIDVSKEIGMLRDCACAKREMENTQAQQRVKYVDTDTAAQVVRYVDEDIKQTINMCKEMLNMRFGKYFEIQKVIFNAPATIVFWKDGTKTVVKAQKGDKFDPEKGLAMAFAKRALGDKGNYYNVFRKHLPKAKVVKTTAGRKKTCKKTTTARKKTTKKTTEDKAMDLAMANGFIVDKNTGEKFIAEPKLTGTSRRAKKEG